MIKLQKDFSKIKNSNLVFLIQKEADLKLLDFLKLDKKILENIKKNFKGLPIVIDSASSTEGHEKKGEKKLQNQTLDFFIGSENFEKIFVLLYLNEKKDLNYFLGDEFRKLPKKLTILPNSSKNIEALLNNAILGRYKYEEYKTEKKEDEIYFIVNKEEEKIAKKRLETIENILTARNLANMPANDLYPESFADLVKKTKFKDVKVKVFDFKAIQKLGMGLLEAVGKGSSKKPQMVILEKITDKKLPTIGLVGKGITFDTGGIQVKPDTHMYDMKGDMSGAASVFATMKELDEKKLNVNIVACLVLAENHISGESYKPSDIFKSYSGKTIDIGHTDAEGRLVLADGISYISKNYKLDKILTIATLTGACMHALGFRFAGIMGTDDDLIGKLLKYSENHIEKYVRLPFDDYYIEKTKGEVADLTNSPIKKIYAGSSMGGAFLYNFLMNNEKFTHLDIAGTAINESEPFGYVNSGMTGFGVDSLSEILKEI